VRIKNMKTTNQKQNGELGFSLVELAITAAIALLLSAITITTLPGVLGSVRVKASAYVSCGVNHNTVASSFLDGNEPTFTPSC
jgi:type II secretory pathway pseudopilin PulG